MYHRSRLIYIDIVSMPYTLTPATDQFLVVDMIFAYMITPDPTPTLFSTLVTLISYLLAIVIEQVKARFS